MVDMRRSRTLRKLREGKVVGCFKLNLADARAAEIVALAGFDCLWLCQEHVANDYAVIEKQILAAKAHDVDVLVRVPRGSYSDYIRPLELDATGIMVPHVMGVEDAKQVIWWTRFHPVGRRPMDGGNADGAYGQVDLLDYLEQANRERFVALQIEDPEPVGEIEEIAALDGFDILFFGPGDFTHGIGAPAQWDHPKVEETRRRVAEAAADHGKFAGCPGNPDNIDELVEMGFRFITMGADVIGLGNYCREIRGVFAPYD